MIKIRNLHKSFGALQVLKGIDFTASEGEVVAVIGPSGMGKSTFLRCINFIEKPEKGLWFFRIIMFLKIRQYCKM